MKDVVIPYRGYWSTPFARWQGSFAHLHSLRFAADVAKRELARRNIDPAVFDYGVLGLTVPQQGTFYGLPWLMGLLGAAGVAGPTVSQACATGARALKSVADEIAGGGANVALAVCADRTSNGPHIYYPAPDAAGGTGSAENWVMDNFSSDPFTGCAMIRTAENVVARYKIETAEQNALTLVRYEQYAKALADDCAFLKRFMDVPFEVPANRGRRPAAILDRDEGIHATTAEGLAALKPVLQGGTISYGNQTHPADGNAAIVVTTSDRARELSADPSIKIRLLGFGQARVEPAYMPMAPVPAAQRALAAAGVQPAELDAITTHNPFIVNDIVLARELHLNQERINAFGCSLVWGHPQAPTGLRAVIELIETLVTRGGGIGLFTGCAAGDSSMAVVLRVDGGR